MSDRRLLNVDENAKTIKGQKQGYLTGVLYLSPSTLSGKNVCAFATPGCIATCLNTAGRGRFDKTQAVRIRKTQRFLANTAEFVDALGVRVAALVKRAHKRGLRPTVRLNGTSDLPWENLTGRDGRSLMEAFPRVQFYDYTKNPYRMNPSPHQHWPKNYQLVFSRSECNEADALKVLARGQNVAVVFSTRRGQPLPTRWQGWKVIDGDRHDLRFKDPRGVVIGLRAKGRARNDRSGFVVRVEG